MEAWPAPRCLGQSLLSQLQPSVVRFRQSLLTSSPSSLRGLADCLLQLATGHPAPQLDHHLETILGETEVSVSAFRTAS